MALTFVTCGSCAAQNCADYAMGVGVFVDVKNSGITYAYAKQNLAEKKKKENMSGAAYKQYYKLLSEAYEEIPANVSAVNASISRFNVCKGQTPASSSDICFGLAGIAGVAATERDKGRSMDSQRSEFRNKDIQWGEVMLKKAYDQKNTAPWDLQQQQYFNCKKNMKL